MEQLHFSEFNDYMLKLNAFLKPIGLIGSFDYERFPMRLTITRNDEDDQINFVYENEEDEDSIPPRITMIYDVNRIDIKCEGDVNVSELTLNKIKNFGKKAYLAFVQSYFSASCLLGNKIERVEELERRLSEI